MSTEKDASEGDDFNDDEHKALASDEAKSALQLLRSLAAARASPENLEQAFLDWARLSDEARAYPEFEHILITLFGDSQEEREDENDPNVAAKSIQKFDISDVFFVDENGTILDIGSELSTLLNLKAGDALEPGIFQDLYDRQLGSSEVESAPPTTIELRDKFDLKRRIVLHRIIHARRGMKYAAVYIRVTLSERAENELRETYKLTKSELEILGLALQRYTPEHIAKIRNSKLNTVRTHISRLIQKTECHSLNETIGFALELSLATQSDVPSIFGRRTQVDRTDRRVAIPQQSAVVDYSKYGSVSGKPVIVLHSLEYGFEPTKAMIEAAKARGICLYFVRRSGFGGTTATKTLGHAASLIDGFISALELTDVTIVALSTAAPQALVIENVDDRISHMLLVNYGLDAKGKIDMFEPAWIRGLIKMGLAAPASFSAGVEVVRGFWRTFGTERLYRMMYASVESDLEYLEQHIDLFENSSDIIYKASRTNIRLDIMSSFLENRDLPKQVARHHSLLVATGEHYFKASTEALRDTAETLGVEFRTIPGEGRNWPFAQPDILFDLISPKAEL